VVEAGAGDSAGGWASCRPPHPATEAIAAISSATAKRERIEGAPGLARDTEVSRKSRGKWSAAQKALTFRRLPLVGMLLSDDVAVPAAMMFEAGRPER
jgi:hypothetical protein